MACYLSCSGKKSQQLTMTPTHVPTPELVPDSGPVQKARQYLSQWTKNTSDGTFEENCLLNSDQFKLKLRPTGQKSGQDVIPFL